MLTGVPLSEHELVDREVFKRFADNQKARADFPGFKFPPIALMVDAHSRWDYRDYVAGGRKVAGLVTDLVRRHAPAAQTIFEWGCGPGRIIRHLPEKEFLGRDRKYFGSDYNRGSIEWCSANLPHIDFRLNGLNPPLPFETGAFDFTYCRSVFTHLERQNALDWMRELRRVTKPDGVICFSTQSQPDLSRLSKEELKQFEAGLPVEWARGSQGLRDFAAFLPASYVRGTLIGDCELVSHLPGRQDTWVVVNK